jgi:DNA-directed RNA polymerase specialized sigma24 family protein
MNVSRQSILEYAKPMRALDLATADGMWKRVELLRSEDRLLVELALRAGASHRRIAQVVHCTAGAVSRRLARLGRRLHDPLVLALLHPACPLEPSYRQIGVERLLTGLSVRELAEKHQLSLAQVRRIVHFVQTWHRGLGGRRGREGFGGQVPMTKSQ